MVAQLERMASRHIVILTGAGISAESGLQTFRGSDGLWCGHRVEDVATPEAFARNPALVQEFYNLRRAQLRDVQPNAAHLALAKLMQEFAGHVTLITQNVDDLHQRAAKIHPPSPRSRFMAMHGQLKRVRCLLCEAVSPWEDALHTDSLCPACDAVGKLRPHIVWFGEMPLYMNLIDMALESCDLFLSIGTSGNVYPAAGFVQQLRAMGRAQTVELNLEPSQGTRYFDEYHHGKATEIVVRFCDNVLNGRYVF